MKLKFRNMKQSQRASILFFFGLLFGIILANALRKYYIGDMRILNYTYSNILENQKIDYTGLLKYTLLNNLKEYLLFWILCFTTLGIPFVFIAVIYKGVEIGFMISSVTILYGSKGILLFFAYVMPQALIYVPVMLISLQKGYELAQHSYARSKNHIELKKSILLSYIALIFMLLALLLIGSIMETYFGSGLLRRTLKLCI